MYFSLQLDGAMHSCTKMKVHTQPGSHYLTNVILAWFNKKKIISYNI